MVKSIKINISFIYFTLLTLYFGFVNTPFQFSKQIQNTLLGIMVVIFLFWLLRQNYTGRDIVWLIFLFLFAGITAWKTNVSLLIDVMSAVVFSRSQRSTIFKLIFWERIGINIFRSIFSLTGIIQNKVQVAKSGLYVTGYGLGFDNPNNLAVEIGMLILLYVCIKESSISFKNILLIIIITLATYRLTLSRTFIGMMTVTILLLIGIKYFGKLKSFVNLYKFVGVISLAIGFIISIGIPYVMNMGIGNLDQLFDLLNHLTSNRFLHASRVMLHYPITLFGGIGDFDILDSIYKYSIVDDSYIHLLYGFGIVGTIIFVILYTSTIITLIRNKKLYWVMPIIIFIMWGMSEGVLYSLHWNFSILLWGVILRKNYSSVDGRNLKKKGLVGDNVKADFNYTTSA